MVGINFASAFWSGGQIGKEIVAVLDGGIRDERAAVLPEGIVTIGDIRKLAGETELLVVRGVIAA